MLREEKRALERRAASADELRETVVRLEVEVEVARAERESWYAIFFSLCFYAFGADFVQTFRAKNAVPETPAATPVSITQSPSALRLEHAHLLEEHGAHRTALRQREAELAEVQAREVDARATADAFLQASRAALAEREVAFLKALNVCSRSPLGCFVVSFSSGMLIHLPRIGELRQQGSCAGLW